VYRLQTIVYAPSTFFRVSLRGFAFVEFVLRGVLMFTDVLRNDHSFTFTSADRKLDKVCELCIGRLETMDVGQ